MTETSIVWFLHEREWDVALKVPDVPPTEKTTLELYGGNFLKRVCRIGLLPLPSEGYKIPELKIKVEPCIMHP